MDNQTSGHGAPRVPSATRAAGALVAVEGGLLLVLAGWLAVAIVTQDEADLGLALVEVAIAAAAGVALLLLGRGVWRGSPATRSPVVVVQLLALPVGWTLLGGGRIASGVVVVGLALAVLGLLLFNPAARRSLDRGR